MPGRMLAEKDGAIGWMIFDHPERRNAVTQAMWLQIGEILEDFAKDEAIRVVVLKGAGDKAFVSGADISQFGQQRRNAAEVAASNRLTDAARQALATFAKPTIAMIQGYCLGGGLAIALMCDLRFASEDSTFGIPAARLGVGYAAPSIGLLTGLGRTRLHARDPVYRPALQRRGSPAHGTDQSPAARQRNWLRMCRTTRP